MTLLVKFNYLQVKSEWSLSKCCENFPINSAALTDSGKYRVNNLILA